MHKYKKIYSHLRTKVEVSKNSPVFLFEPSVATLNLGDGIITESCRHELRKVYKHQSFINCSSHLPQSTTSWTRAWQSQKSFVCGSNLLCSDMYMGRAWNISLLDSIVLPKAILMGVGWNNYQKKASLYTQLLYKNVLSKNAIHSVRDTYTEKKLKEIGIDNVENTGCPTMWRLTEAHCESIPSSMGKAVVFTLTDYRKSIKEDVEFIKALVELYETVYFWPQGSQDLEYFNNLSRQMANYKDSITIIAQSLVEFNKLLSCGNVDFVGTRLHAGVKALQKQCRTIIIGVDNRAVEKKKDFNLPVIDRYKTKEEYKDNISKKFSVEIKLNDEAISRWKEQFK